MTPHKFVLRTRLHRTAVRLRRSEDLISAIAFEMGFGDLSTFNRRFHRMMGISPSAYRAKTGGIVPNSGVDPFRSRIPNKDTVENK